MILNFSLRIIKMNCTFCKQKQIKAYLVPYDEFIFGKWSVECNWCGECEPNFQKTRINMNKVKEELLSIHKPIY